MTLLLVLPDAILTLEPNLKILNLVSSRYNKGYQGLVAPRAI